MKWEGGQVSPFPNPPPQLCSIHLGVAQLQDTSERSRHKIAEQHLSTTQCPLWVISGHRSSSNQCPLYPRKRTLIERLGMSALCQKQTFNCYSTNLSAH